MTRCSQNAPARARGLRAAAATLGLCAGLSIWPVAAQQASAADASQSVAGGTRVDVAAATQTADAQMLPLAQAEVATAQVEDTAQAGAPPRVGDATRQLLALQRSGQYASAAPRPIPGDIAQRSRERYLKSFEREIPERFQSSVGASKQGGGSN